MLEIHQEFLRDYAKSVDIDEEEPEKIMESLCEKRYYIGEYDEQFSSILYGYLWGKTGDFEYANVSTGLLLSKLNEILKGYSEVVNKYDNGKKYVYTFTLN